MKAVFKGVVSDGDHSAPIDSEEDYSVQDGGRARVQTFRTSDEDGLFVRLQSWSDDGTHEDWKKFAGKKVRVTVEVEPEVDPLNRAINLLNEFYFDGGPRTHLHNEIFDFLQSIDRGPTMKRIPE